MQKKQLWVIGATLLTVILMGGSAIGAPYLINFQGTLNDATTGDPITDPGIPMIFRIYDAETFGTLQWEETQTVSVNNGVYNVLLGDGTTTYGSFDSVLFAQDNRWIEIEINGETLTPRQRITSGAYVLNADTLDGLDSSLFALIGDLSTGGSGAQVNWDNIMNIPGGFDDDSIDWLDIQGRPAGLDDGDDTGITIEVDPQVGSNSLNYVPIWNGSQLVTGSLYDNGNVGIGTTTPRVKFSLGQDITLKKLALFDDINNFYGFGMDWFRMTFYTADTEKMTIWNNGHVGIGTILPETKLAIEDSDAAIVQLNQTGAKMWTGYRMKRAGTEEWFIGMDPSDEDLLFHRSASSNVMVVKMSGDVGIGTENPGAKLDIDYGNIVVRGTNSWEAAGDEAIVYLGNSHHYIKAVHGSGVHIGAYSVGDVVKIEASSGRVGIGTMSPTQKLDVAGTAKVDVLQITGGSDLSEKFEVRGIKEKLMPSPGMVVSIDPERPGDLMVSNKAYDRKVAGIISGAGGVKPGMLMGQEGSEADGANPVALTGRVYCWADASKGAIKPGDLLTTSDTPGHAMKVTEYARAQGAILGKAMTSLESDKGLVLVLVTLQ